MYFRFYFIQYPEVSSPEDGCTVNRWVFRFLSQPLPSIITATRQPSSRARLNPGSRAWVFPWFSSMRMTSAPANRATKAVLSGDPSSTTMTRSTICQTF